MLTGKGFDPMHTLARAHLIMLVEDLRLRVKARQVLLNDLIF